MTATERYAPWQPASLPATTASFDSQSITEISGISAMRRRTVLPLMLSSLLSLAVAFPHVDLARSLGDESDQIDGALWKFEMLPVKNGPAVRYGQFRVKGKFLYQKSKPDSQEFDKVVGEKVAAAKKVTRLRIDDLRARSKGDGPQSGIKGNLELKFDEKGKWHGKFVDSAGAHWNVTCERFQE